MLEKISNFPISYFNVQNKYSLFIQKVKPLIITCEYHENPTRVGQNEKDNLDIDISWDILLLKISSSSSSTAFRSPQLDIFAFSEKGFWPSIPHWPGWQTIFIDRYFFYILAYPSDSTLLNGRYKQNPGVVVTILIQNAAW